MLVNLYNFWNRFEEQLANNFIGKYYANFNNIITKTDKLLPANFRNLLVLYENWWDTKEDNNYLKIDPIQLKDQIMFSSEVMEGVIVWYHPLVFAFSDEGIFSRRN